jgi:signal recognition particle GTPase
MSSSEQEQAQKKPTVIITIGMAGSGKTTFMQVKK